MANGHQPQGNRPLQTVVPVSAPPPAQTVRPPTRDDGPPPPAEVRDSDVEVHVSAREDIDQDERVAMGERMVEVRPRRTITSVQIGHDSNSEPRWFSFTAGKRTTVPKAVIPHLEEKGII